MKEKNRQMVHSRKFIDQILFINDLHIYNKNGLHIHFGLIRNPLKAGEINRSRDE